jgi:hypothetical protein
LLSMSGKRANPMLHRGSALLLVDAALEYLRLLAGVLPVFDVLTAQRQIDTRLLPRRRRIFINFPCFTSTAELGNYANVERLNPSNYNPAR